MYLGVFALETGVGAPTVWMTPWERLEVPVDADKRTIRKAYHKKSLEWHPDRWVAHPEYMDKAEEAFDLISDAYSKLQEQASQATASTTTIILE